MALIVPDNRPVILRWLGADRRWHQARVSRVRSGSRKGRLLIDAPPEMQIESLAKRKRSRLQSGRTSHTPG